MGFSPESYTFMTMGRLQTNKYCFFIKFLVFGQALKKYKVICINDINVSFDFAKVKTEILTIIEEKFSQKSSFELD